MNVFAAQGNIQNLANHFSGRPLRIFLHQYQVLNTPRFLDSSTLTVFRERLGPKGAAIIEDQVFGNLRRTGVIKNDVQLTDSTVMKDNIVYPADVLLLYRAFKKMRQFAKRNQVPLWWDEAHLKKRWRAYSLAGKIEKVTFLWEFYLLFVKGLGIFRIGNLDSEF